MDRTNIHLERTILHIFFFFFFLNDTAPPEISTLSLHDALPISRRQPRLSLRPQEGGSDRADREEIHRVRPDRPLDRARAAVLRHGLLHANGERRPRDVPPLEGRGRRRRRSRGSAGGHAGPRPPPPPPVS